MPPRNEIALLLGPLPAGFSYPKEKLDFFSEKDIFTEEKVIVSRASRRPFFSQFQDLQAGDYVVHADYGIGVFRGLQRIEVEGKGREFIELHYRDDDKLLVPVEDLNLVQKFSKAGPELPPLDKLGTNTWEKTRTRAKKAVEAVAKELVELYAQRRAVKGHAFSSGGQWDEEFGKTFEYEETDDQLRSIREIRGDMERETSMDRLLCGDVGYGKTEVAMRAAFKAVMDGKQVAVLCPTTVLASQHLKTFRDRMVLFPVRVEALTRLQTPREQKADRRGLPQGLRRHPHRHAPAPLQGRRLQGPRPAHRRRGAALRRRPQGEDQAAQGHDRRPDPDRDAHPADAQHVALRACATSASSRRRRATGWPSTRS